MDEPRAKATVQMVINKKDGNLSATDVRAKTDEYDVEMVLRFLNIFECRSKLMENPTIFETARRVQTRHDKITVPTSV